MWMEYFYYKILIKCETDMTLVSRDLAGILKGIVSNGFINVLFNNKFGKGFWKWIQYSVIKRITNGSITC